MNEWEWLCIKLWVTGQRRKRRGPWSILSQRTVKFDWIFALQKPLWGLLHGLEASVADWRLLQCLRSCILSLSSWGSLRPAWNAHNTRGDLNLLRNVASISIDTIIWKVKRRRKTKKRKERWRSRRSPPQLFFSGARPLASFCYAAFFVTLISNFTTWCCLMKLCAVKLLSFALGCGIGKGGLEPQAAREHCQSPSELTWTSQA